MFGIGIGNGRHAVAHVGAGRLGDVARDLAEPLSEADLGEPAAPQAVGEVADILAAVGDPPGPAGMLDAEFLLFAFRQRVARRDSRAVLHELVFVVVAAGYAVYPEEDEEV